MVRSLAALAGGDAAIGSGGHSAVEWLELRGELDALGKRLDRWTMRTAEVARASAGKQGRA